MPIYLILLKTTKTNKPTKLKNLPIEKKPKNKNNRKILVYTHVTIGHVIATVTQEQTERATHSERLIIMPKYIKTQPNKRG